MNIVVCIKRVPDTEARVKASSDGSTVETTGAKFVMNPYDEFAVEAALAHRDDGGEGKVTVLSVGTSDSAETLRSALAMGADEAVLLKTDEEPEGLAVAKLIAAELKERSADLVLFGMKAVDDDLQAVGAMVAELMEIPSATVVTEFSVDGGKISADREIEGGVEVVELSTPCALTITKGAYEPRYPNLKGIMAAKKKPLEEKDAGSAENGLSDAKFSDPPARAEGRIVGEGADAVPELIRLLREEAKVL